MLIQMTCEDHARWILFHRHVEKMAHFGDKTHLFLYAREICGTEENQATIVESLSIESTHRGQS